MWLQWRIQGIFSEGAPAPKLGVLTYYFVIFFTENCVKMKEFRPGGWGILGALPLVSANELTNVS